ncbi:MAG: hypothetical protein Q7U48_13610 [Hydrogenophaga sp.]|nr:hypothetical protein [Hydrogenophaga sp.]
MNIEITDFQVHNVVQGTPEWHALRALPGTCTASEAPAMLGVSTKMTRNQLLTAKATGLTKDVSDYVQRFLFDKGHETEKQFLPHAEDIVGEALYPITVTAVVNGIRMLASCDGATVAIDKLMEHKLMNNALVDFINVNGEPDLERVFQVEQQLLVTGADSVLVAVGDGTRENTTTCWYESKPERRRQLILGWQVFMEDLARWTPADAVEIPKLEGAVVEKLPALVVNVTGELAIDGNMDQWKAMAERWLAAAPKAAELESDQDFADAETFGKECKNVEDQLELLKSQALAQSRPLEELVLMMAEIKERVGQTRISLERSVKLRKDNIKAKIVTDATASLMQYVGALDRDLGARLMPQITADFGGAAKNKRNLASLKNAVETELSGAKAKALEAHLRIKANLASLKANGEDHTALFPDLAAVCNKATDDFGALLQVRVQKHKDAVEAAAEKKRQEERAAEERKKAADDAAAAAAAVEAAAAAAKAAYVAPAAPVEQVEQPQAHGETQSVAQPRFGGHPALVRRTDPLVEQPAPRQAAPVAVSQDALDAQIDEFMATLTLPAMVRGAVRAAIGDWEAFKAVQMRSVA